MTATGCAPSGTDLYWQARNVNLTMKQEIAALQLHIFDGEWSASEYGEIPSDCGGNGYRFSMRRTVPFVDGWRLPQETTQAKADALVAWLDEHDWSGIIFRSYTGGVTSVTIEAQKPEAYVDDLLINLTTGVVDDVLSLTVAGTCEPGDDDELVTLMYPDGLGDYEERPTEHPSTEPKFGLATPSPTPTP